MVRQASSSRTEDTGLVPLCCLQGKHPPRKQFLLLASCLLPGAAAFCLQQLSANTACREPLIKGIKQT